jgi:hypothetical protein
MCFFVRLDYRGKKMGESEKILMQTGGLERWLAGSPRRVHLIGVAGSGMSRIAGLLMAMGHRVSGSDKVRTVEVTRLCAMGLDFHTPSSQETVMDADLVVYSSAIRSTHPDFALAMAYGKILVRRAEALAALLAAQRGIVVAGMHGKTTTSALLSFALEKLGACLFNMPGHAHELFPSGGLEGAHETHDVVRDEAEVGVIVGRHTLQEAFIFNQVARDQRFECRLRSGSGHVTRPPRHRARRSVR